MTNDNLPALYFHQRHGYRLSATLRDSIVALVPKFPVAGFAGISIRDEIQLVKESRPIRLHGRDRPIAVGPMLPARLFSPPRHQG